MTEQYIYSNLPEEIKSLLVISRGWLVAVKDYDIVVPDQHLFQLALIYAYNAKSAFKVNTFGGIKLGFKDFSVDIWSEEFDHFLSTCSYFKFGYKLTGDILIKNYASTPTV